MHLSHLFSKLAQAICHDFDKVKERKQKCISTFKVYLHESCNDLLVKERHMTKTRVNVEQHYQNGWIQGDMTTVG